MKPFYKPIHEARHEEDQKRYVITRDGFKVITISNSAEVSPEFIAKLCATLDSVYLAGAADAKRVMRDALGITT